MCLWLVALEAHGSVRRKESFDDHLREVPAEDSSLQNALYADIGSREHDETSGVQPCVGG